MIIISLNWDNTIVVLGVMNVLIGSTCVILWLLISQKPFIKQVPERFVVAVSQIEKTLAKKIYLIPTIFST